MGSGEGGRGVRGGVEIFGSVRGPRGVDVERGVERGRRRRRSTDTIQLDMFVVESILNLLGGGGMIRGRDWVERRWSWMNEVTSKEQ